MIKFLQQIKDYFHKSKICQTLHSKRLQEFRKNDSVGKLAACTLFYEHVNRCTKNINVYNQILNYKPYHRFPGFLKTCKWALEIFPVCLLCEIINTEHARILFSFFILIVAKIFFKTNYFKQKVDGKIILIFF